MAVEFEIFDRVLLVYPQQVTKVQALWRGHRVRNRMKKLREAYNSLYSDVEGSSSLQVYWGPSIEGLIKKPLFLRDEEISKLLQEDKFREATGKTPINKVNTDSSKINSNVHSETQSKLTSSDGPHSERSQSNTTNKAIAGEALVVSINSDNINQNQPDSLTVQNNKSEIIKQVETRTGNSDNHQPLRLEQPFAPNQPEKSNQLVQASHSVRSDRLIDSNQAVRPAHSTQHGVMVDPSVKKGGEVTGRDHTGIMMSQTSLWDSSHDKEQPLDIAELENMSKEELKKQRGAVAMELLWVQQALDSRKQYLRLKSQMSS